MKKTLLTLALSALGLASSFASTLQANAIFATTAENYNEAVRFAIHNDQAGLEEMDREFKINVFKVPLEVIIRQPGFLVVGFSFPEKTHILYTAAENIKA